MPDHLIVLGPNGEPSFLIETRPSSGVDEQLKSLRGEGEKDLILNNLSAVGDAVVGACDSVIRRVRDSLTNAAPDELELSFAVTLSAEAGLPIFSKVGGDATFEIRAKWQRTQPLIP